MLSDKKTNTVNPLYNDIRHNSRIHYNANSVRTKSNESSIFSLTVHVILQENIRFEYFLEPPPRGDSNKYPKRMNKKKGKRNRSKVSIISALDGSIPSFFITANSIL